VLASLTIFAVTASAFIGTNLDNLILLVALHTRYREHPAIVTAGYVAGMLLILGICLLIGEVGELIPIAYLGLLGVIPITTGCLALIRLFTKPGPQATNTSITAGAGAGAIFITLLTTQLSNSSDTIIAFSLLLADSKDFFDLQIIPVFLAMMGIFAWLARFLVNHRRLGEFLKRYGHYITPFILIMVGVFILSNTATDLMPGS
jgi:cadmium resistance protein CadD (predicted permease)